MRWASIESTAAQSNRSSSFFEGMGSKPSKAKRRSTPMATKKVIVSVVSRIPPEITDEILDHLVADSGFGDYDSSLVQRSLRSCSLVSKSFVPSCRRHLFHTITFTMPDLFKWIKTFPVPEESPAYYVKDLRFSLGAHFGGPKEFVEHTPWFTNAEKLTVTVDTAFRPIDIPFFARLPQSPTSLTMEALSCQNEFVHMLDVMAQLPNLENVTVSGNFVVRVGKPRPATAPRGRFGGELRIRNGQTEKSFVNLLLEVPTGLHFTKIHVHPDCACLLQTVRLVEACCETLVELTYMGSILGKSSPALSDLLAPHSGSDFLLIPSIDFQGPLERSFDFSNFPRLQKVTFDAHRVHGPIHFIPVALSTLKPSTSPHLSHIYFGLSGPRYSNFYYFIKGTSNLENMGSDLRRIAEEFSRIEREYEGAVDLSVVRSTGYEPLDKLTNVRFFFSFAWRRDTRPVAILLAHPLQVLRHWEC